MWVQYKLKINRLSWLNTLLFVLFLILLIDFAPDHHLDTVAFLLHVAHHIHSLPIAQNNALIKSALTLIPIINHSIISISSHTIISKVIIFAVAVSVLSIITILKKIIEKEIIARISSVSNLSLFKSYQEAIKAFENLP